ncbi:hypothetical protein K439DRAFT_1619427 [Ramaria rubella]|nr:hypothetical protein K439DRAFT_1619427 [Ramaria rubella]
MASPKQRKKSSTSIPSLEVNVAVAEVKSSKARKKSDMKMLQNKKKQKKKAPKKDDQENGGSEGEDGERSGSSAAIVKWANPDLHYLTSTLINMISDDWVWQQAFNFDTSNSVEPINSGGKKTRDHHREIARILLQEDASGTWVDTNMKTLKKYFELRKELGSTGHGLIEEDREEDIWENSAISNVWGAFYCHFYSLMCMYSHVLEKIQKAFPWYKDLSVLLKASPIVDQEASANSVTDLDLSILMPQRSTGSEGPMATWNDGPSDMEHASGDEELIEGVPGSPHLDALPAGQKLTKHRRSPTGLPPSQMGTKKNRQSFLEKASELAASQNAAISKVIKNNNVACQERKKMEGDIAVHIKKMEMKHEMEMMERQMELEHKYEMACLEHTSRVGMNVGGSIPTSSTASPNSHLLTDFGPDVSLTSSDTTHLDNTHPVLLSQVLKEHVLQPLPLQPSSNQLPILCNLMYTVIVSYMFVSLQIVSLTHPLFFFNQT